MTSHKGHCLYFSGFLSLANLRPFPVINFSNICPKLNYPSGHLNVGLTSHFSLRLLVFIAHKSLSSFFSLFYLNVNTTPLMLDNSLGICCRQTLWYVICQMYSSISHVQQIIQLIIGSLISPVTFFSQFRANTSKQYRLNAFTSKWN